VAKVSSKGLVTAAKAGTATITCTSKADTSKKASCTVTVNAPEDPNSTLAKPDNFNSGDSPF
jgi:glycerophosphoryl diester phosphodiesterase